MTLKRALVLLTCCMLAGSAAVSADDTFDKLSKAKKYKEALDYADESMPPANRTAGDWVAIAQANEEMGLQEKALACYLVSSRMNPKDYSSWIGSARIYNKMGDADNALSSAKKALDLNFTAEASWEYASACIKLNRATEARQALEKVMESDPNNAVANRELGNIYFSSKDYAKAIPLLKKSYEKKMDPDVAYKIGKAALEAGDAGTAMEYMKIAVRDNTTVAGAGLELARAYFKAGDFGSASAEFDKAFVKGRGEAMDYYNNAVAKERNKDAKGAQKSYETAVREFGQAKSKEALLARLVVGKGQLEAKQFSDANANFKFIVTSDPKSDAAKDIFFLLADSYEGMKQISDAISSLEKALALNNKNVEGYARLADLYKRNKMEDKAKATYEKMIALSPNDPNIYLILGDYNLKSKKYPEALGNYEKSFVLGRSAKAAEGIAVCAAELNQWEKAGDAAESAINLDGSLSEPRIVLYRFNIKRENYAAAAKQLETLVEKDAQNVEYWKSLALCYSKVKSVDKLAKADRKVIDLDKKDVDSRLRFAAYSMSQKDSKTAYVLYKELAVLAPSNPEVFQNLYKIAMAAGEKDNALGYVKTFVKLNARDAESQRDMGDLLYEKKDMDGALTAYRQALAIDPALKGFHKRYAEIVIAKGQHDEAIKALSLKIKSGEATADDYTTLGTIYQKKKSFQSAVESYQKSLQMNPQNIEVLSALAECQASMGQTSEAIITYEQVIMMNQKAGPEYKALAELYLREKKTDQAMKAFRKFLETSPVDNAVAISVGNYLLGKKEYADAAKYLEMVKGKEAEAPAFQASLVEAYFSAKNYKKCIETAEALMRRGGTPPASAAKYLAQAYEADNQELKAADAYLAYSKLAGVRDENAAYKSAFLREKTARPQAVTIYEQNITKYPRDYRNFLQLGLYYSEKKETLSKAISMFNKISSMADSFPVIYLKLGEVYGKLGKQDQELDAYKSYIKFEPQNPQANKRIGLILVKGEKFKEGLIYLETSSTLNPKDPEILFGLAEGYAKTGRPDESVSALEKAKLLSPKDARINTQLYKMYIKVNRPKDAKKCIEELLASDPNNPETHLVYAQLLFDEKRFPEAKNEIENVMASNPTPDALGLLALIKTAEKDFEGAIATYDEIIAMSDMVTPRKMAEALYYKAELYRLYGKELKKSPKWAETFYERALRADPTYAKAKLGMARLQKLWKRDDLYRKYLSDGMAMDPSDKEIQEEFNTIKK